MVQTWWRRPSGSVRLIRRGPVLFALGLSLSGCSTIEAMLDDSDESAPETTAIAAPDLESAEGDAASETGEQSDAESGDESDSSEGEQAARSLFDIDAVLAADPDCPEPVSGETLVIGYAADLGAFGVFADGPASQTTSHIAELINCSGGLDGRPVEVVVSDVSGTDPLASRDATIELLEAGAQALLGPPFPDPGFRVLQATNGQVPVLFTGSTEPALADASQLSFLVAFNDTQGATAAAQFAQTKGWGRAAVFGAAGPYFGYNADVFAAAFNGQGGTVTAEYSFVPQDQVDFGEAVADMVTDPPDVVYSPMFADQWVVLRRQLDEAGLADVELLGSDAFEATNGYALAGTDGLFHVTHTDPGDETRLQALLNSFADANGGVPPASPSMAALAGDAMAVIAEAYLQSKPEDPASLGEAIANIGIVEGVSGELIYDGSGAPAKPMYIHQVVDGQPTLAAIIGD